MTKVVNEKSAKPKAISAMLDVMGGRRSPSGDLVHEIPPERFGKGKARILRKMVLLAIAANANPDGTGSWPSRETIAGRCLVTVRAVAKAINWLVRHKLLKVESKAAATSKYGRTNIYQILFPKARSRERKASEHKEMEVHSRETTPGTTGPSTGNNSHEHEEQMNLAPGNGSSYNLPFVPPSVDRPSTPATASAVAVAGSLTSTERPNPLRKDEEQRALITHAALMGKVQKIWRDHYHDRVLQTTKAHVGQALRMAEEYGQDTFLAAWDHWLQTEPSETFWVLTGEIDAATDEGTREFRAWPLDYFITSGGAELHIERVRPFVHTKGNMLGFLVWAHETFGEQIELNPEQMDVLSEAMYKYSKEFLEHAYRESKDLIDFVEHLDQYVEAAKPEYYERLSARAGQRDSENDWYKL
jgi:hypothetical protein